MIAALLGLAMISGAEGALRFGARGPAGPGQPEPTKGAACAECQKHAPYLDTGDDCFCHASDIMTTFANDATKTLTTNSKYGSQTQQTGAGIWMDVALPQDQRHRRRLAGMLGKGTRCKVICCCFDLKGRIRCNTR